MTHWSIVCALVVHDLLLRAFWRFYYLRVHRFSNKDEYLDSISRSYKRYLLKQRKRFEDLLAQRAVHVVAVDKCTPRLEKFVLEQSSLRGNTAFKNIIYRLSLRSILTSRHSDAYIVVDRNTDQIICFEANYRSGHVYYWLDTFIDAMLPLAEGCSATGWVTSFCVEHNWMLSQFPEAAYPAEGLALLDEVKKFLLAENLVSRDFALAQWRAPEA